MIEMENKTYDKLQLKDEIQTNQTFMEGIRTKKEIKIPRTELHKL